MRIIKNHIDIDGELTKLAGRADYLTGKDQSDVVVLNFSDMNNRTIDISNVKEKVVIIELSSDFLEQPQDITIKGLDSDTKDGQVVIINVQSSKDALNLATKTRLIYDDNTQLSPNESHAKPNHILWNFGNKVKTVNISSGYFMGSVLAPNAEVNVDVNVDGNLVAQTVNIRGGESHRWDLWEPVTPIFPRPVIPHWHGEEEFVEPSKDHGKPDGGKNTPGKPSDGEQPVKADIDKSQYSQPGKSDQPSQPTSPVKSQDSKPGKSSNVTKPTPPVQPTSPSEPVEPGKSTNVTKPTSSVRPTSPSKPTEPGKSSNVMKPTTPVQPTLPSKPTEPGKSSNVTKPTSPVQPTNPGKPAQPVKAIEHSQSSAEFAQLPQTGNMDNKLGIIGLMVASVVMAINLLKKEF